MKEEKKDKFEVYIVEQRLNNGFVHSNAFTSLEEAQKCKENWFAKYSTRAYQSLVYKQIVYDHFDEEINKIPI